MTKISYRKKISIFSSNVIYEQERVNILHAEQRAINSHQYILDCMQPVFSAS